MRVPMIARWPGTVPAGTTCDQLATTMDLLPTLCALARLEPPGATIDGHDIGPLLRAEEEARSRYECFYYWRRRQLQAVRWGNWKYHLPLQTTHPNWTSPIPVEAGRPGKLVDLSDDLQETTDLSEEHPRVVARMLELAEQARIRLGDGERQGREQRMARTLKD